MAEITKVLAYFPELTSTHPRVIRTPLHVLVKKIRERDSPGEATPNAGAHLLPEAAARHERRLEAVRCSALLGAASGTSLRFDAPPGSPSPFFTSLAKAMGAPWVAPRLLRSGGRCWE